MNLPDEKRILELLIKKKCLFEEILFCAEEQDKLSFSEEPAQYNDLVEKREKVIETIKKTDIMLNSYLNQANLQNNTDFQREITDYNDSIQETIKKILMLDERIKAELTTEQKNIGNKLQMLQNGKKGAAEYLKGNNLNISGAYTDSRR